jgi:hypothetical protein
VICTETRNTTQTRQPDRQRGTYTGKRKPEKRRRTMDKQQVLDIIHSYPNKKIMLKEKQTELSKVINEKETEIGSLPCTLGKSDGGGGGISDTTYRKTEKAMKYDTQIQELIRVVNELREDIEKIERALIKLEPISKTVLELRELPKYDERKKRWERTQTWGEIAKATNYSRMQCTRIYNNTLCNLEKMLQNVTK